jgi:arylamine N-acetyltransferase
MTAPNVHTSLRVRVDGVPYHVDCGYGGPFREPLRLDRLPHAFAEGSVEYVLDRSAGPDTYEMRLLSGTRRLPGYVVHDPPRPAGFFEPVIQKSFTGGQTFMNHLRIVKIFDAHSVELFDRKLTIHRGGQTREIELRNRRELKSAVAELAMPRCPIEAALDLVPELAASLR